MSWFTFRFPDFAFSFLSILFEGVPFLLLGSVLSGLIDAFMPAQLLTKFLPKNLNAAIVLSGLLGIIFPMCECSNVVLIRRFIRKGLPVSCAVSYLIGSPTVNVVVALSTLAAFRGQSPVLMMVLRLLLGFCLALLVGFVTRFIPHEMLLQRSILETLPARRRTAFSFGAAPVGDATLDLDETNPVSQKIFRAIQSAASDFLDVAFFFVVGATIAATFNTAVNQQIILPLATSPLLSILVMMLLSFTLALCSSTNAFIGASFVTFPLAAKLAFLVFGPVFDVKLFFLYGAIFRRWFVLSLLVGLFLFIAVACLRIAVLNL